MEWGSNYKSEQALADLLLRAGADPNIRSLQGATPLFYVNLEDLGIIDVLAKHGADVNARAHSGRTPLLGLILDGGSSESKMCRARRSGSRRGRSNPSRLDE